MSKLPEPESIDPANGPFLGDVPTPSVDVLITVIFLILFGLGAFTHISIYRANAKRGHKFLLSDLLFDFCMIRVMTCLFRILWAFLNPRGIVLVANIFENGGAVVIFAVNLFFAQRLVRSMHPSVGWRPVFTWWSLFLIFSVPVITVMNIVVIAVSFFSVGKPGQLDVCERLLKLGSSWNTMLAAMPMVWIWLASAMPGPRPENFGTGDLRAKAALLVLSAAALTVGAGLRLSVLANPEAAALFSTLFNKATFYFTGFVLEIIVIAAYAFLRVDQLFHIPDGASGPGDYSANTDAQPRVWTKYDIESALDSLGLRYEIMSSRGANKNGLFFALLHMNSFEKQSALDETPSAELPPRNVTRVSRRKSLMEAVRPPRPWRADRSTVFVTDDLPPLPEH